MPLRSKRLKKIALAATALPPDEAADIQRYLSNEPVQAQPPSATYRLQKYVRRHRAGVGVAAAFVIALVAFAINQSIQLRRIARERDRADRVSEFMTSMFRGFRSK